MRDSLLVILSMLTYSRTSVTAEAVSGPIDESAEEQTETPIQRISQHGDSEVEEPKPATQLKALAGSGDVNREDTGTPDFVKTSIEVADTAAVLDRPTPVPDESSKTIGEDQATQPSTTPGVDAADTAAEVADTAALLDAEKVSLEYSGVCRPAQLTFSSRTRPNLRLGPRLCIPCKMLRPRLQRLLIPRKP